MFVYKRMLFIGFIVLLQMHSAYASIDANDATNSLIVPVEWLVNFLEGTGGLFAAMCGLVIGLYAAVVNHSLWQVACSIVFEMVLHYMPPVLCMIFGISL